MDRRGDLEAEALIEGDGAGVAGEDVQLDGFGGGGAALLDDGGADALILEIWNEVERYFESVKDEEEKRYMCEEYGLIYVFRRGEKEKIRRKKDAESITLKLF